MRVRGPGHAGGLCFGVGECVEGVVMASDEQVEEWKMVLAACRSGDVSVEMGMGHVFVETDNPDDYNGVRYTAGLKPEEARALAGLVLHYADEIDAK